MANTPCTVKDITLTTVINGTKYQGGVDRDGMELGEIQLVTEFVLPDMREYYCANCRRKFDGSDTYEEVKKHLGTFPLT